MIRTTSFTLATLFSALLIAVPAWAASGTTKVPTRAIILPLEDDADGPVPLPQTQTERDEEPGETDDEQSAAEDDGPPPEIQRDLSKLPAAVRATHTAILKAVETGEIERLRELAGTGDDATSFSIGGSEGDPIEVLKEGSGDEDGIEILAILKEVLEIGYVHMDAGTDLELYVWPYFFAHPLDKLDGPQKVELYTLMTAGEVQDSENFGSYIFYRVGITPDGRWAFFVSGD